MKAVFIISAALIFAGCSDQTPPAKRAASADSVSVPVATQSEITNDGDFAQMLTHWRDHRIERDEASDIDDYTRGFQQGYTGPPGLVDGSADFNLGHSDGMQARMGIVPDKPAAAGGN